jgi:hypothetical protein
MKVIVWKPAALTEKVSVASKTLKGICESVESSVNFADSPIQMPLVILPMGVRLMIYETYV